MENKKLNGVLSVRIIAVLLAVLASIHITCYAYAAEDDSNLIDICEVLTRSNMRSTPSQDGRWVATLPEGAYVLVIEEETDGFTRVEYGAYEGYVYTGCISGTSPHNVEDYTEQFQNYIPTRNLANRSYSVQGSDSAQQQLSGGRVSFDDRSLNFAGTIGAVNVQEETVSVNEALEETEAEQVQAEPVHVYIPDTTAQAAMEQSGSSSSGGCSYYDWVIVSPNRDRSENSSTSEVYRAKATVLADVRLRSLPTVESSKLSTVPINTSVDVLDEGENGFTHVRVDGVEGYIYSRCLDLSGVDFDRLAGIVDVVVTNGNGEASAMSSSARNRVLTSNVLVLTGIPINATAAEVEDGEQEEAVEVATSSNDDMAHEIRTSVNMRSLPNSESEWLATIPTGSDVSIIGQSGDGYTLVQYNGIRGYVLDSCIGDVVDNIDIARLGANPVLFDVTAYCSCRICCGSYSPEVRGGEAHTATGTIPTEGRTIAVDPSVIPYGTHVVVEGYGEYIAEDCGGKITGNHIDIYFESHEAARAFGSRRLYVSVAR